MSNDDSIVNISDEMRAAASSAIQKYDAWQKACEAKIADRLQFGASEIQIKIAEAAHQKVRTAEHEWNAARSALLHVAKEANPQLLPQRPMDGSGHAEWQAQKNASDNVLKAALNQLLADTISAQHIKAPEDNQFFDIAETSVIRRS